MQSFDLPDEFRGANVVVEVVAGDRRVSKPCFALLVLSDEHGAVIQEAAPPKR